MIYGFVRQSGGQVRIYSELGLGTTMCLYLPRHDGDSRRRARRRPMRGAVARGAGETVLVVEDEPACACWSSRCCGELGYTVARGRRRAGGL